MQKRTDASIVYGSIRRGICGACALNTHTESNMLALRLAQALERRHIHYGWVVAALTFLTILTSSAMLGLPGVLLQPLSDEFGWSTDQISGALALRFVLYGMMGPFVAILISRHGLRRTMRAAMMLMATGLILAVFMRSFWHLVLLWGVLLGIATSLAALVLGTIVTNRWFETHRGLVIGVLTASIATGQLMFLPVGAWLVEQYGWRAALYPLFGLALFVGLLAGSLVRDQPEDLGLRPYGSMADTPLPPPALARMSYLTPLRVLYSVRADRTFWILSGTFFVCGLSTSGLIQTHFISLCGDFGLSPLPAASVLSMMGLFDLVGTVLSGWLADRYDNRKLLFWYYGLRGLSLFWLPHSEFTLYGLSLFAMFYGMDWIATVPPTVRLATQAFGREHAGILIGWIFAIHQLGAALAAYLAGLSRTLMLTYTPAIYAAGITCLLAALAVLWIRTPGASAPPRGSVPAVAGKTP